LNELMKIAFGDRIMTDANHPVIQKLLGLR